MQTKTRRDEEEPTSLRWYRIIARGRPEELPFAHFYREHFEKKE